MVSRWMPATLMKILWVPLKKNSSGWKGGAWKATCRAYEQRFRS
jgi:hypothetical protein